MMPRNIVSKISQQRRKQILPNYLYQVFRIVKICIKKVNLILLWAERGENVELIKCLMIRRFLFRVIKVLNNRQWLVYNNAKMSSEIHS